MSITLLKVLSILFMTLDHTAVFLGNVLPYRLCEILRMIGRAAASVFMFALINGAKHTTNRKRYLCRLYCFNLFNIFISIPFELTDIISTPPQILGTFFLTLLYICIIDKIIESKGFIYKVCYSAAAALVAVVPYCIDRLLTENICHSIGSPVKANIVRYIMRAVFPNLRTAEYTALFVIMGILLYYCANKYAQCFVILLFSVFSFYGEFLSPFMLSKFYAFLNSNQIYMILAIPFVFLYNGKKGKGLKYFFYLYYPAHIFILAALSSLITN